MTDQESSTKKSILSVKGLCKYFPIRSKGFMKRTVNYVKAVDNMNFELMPGETLGIVGESGSGKTTAARSILRALKPTAGDVIFRPEGNGREINLSTLGNAALKPLRTQMQMIFQDPFSSLNPRMTVGDIVGEPLRIHNIARGSELTDRVENILEKVGLKPEHRQRYPHAFSGGQRQRIGIARALVLNPSLVIADEAVSALDVSVQAQVINLLQDLQEEFRLTYIFVAHDLSVVRHICDRVAVMYAGKVVELAETETLFQEPKHPYSQALLKAVPDPDPENRQMFPPMGEIADPGNLPPGCSFHPRCPQCFAPCDRVTPKLVDAAQDGHFTACHLYYEPEEELAETGTQEKKEAQ